MSKLLDGVKAHAGTAMAVGIGLILLGIFAICSPFLAGMSVMMVIGWLLVVAGVAQALLAFQVGAFGRGLALLLLGMLLVFAGLSILSRPMAAMATMTLLLAAYLFVSGIIEVVSAFGHAAARGRGWMIASGLVTLALGVMLWRQYPLSGVWAVGTLFGARMLFNGIWLVSVASAARSGVNRLDSALRA